MYTKKFVTEGLDKELPLIWDTETLGLYGRTRLIQVRQGDVHYEYDCFYINIEEVKFFFKDWHLVMHNAHYDLSCVDFKRWIPRELDCTLAASRIQYPELNSHSLDNLCRELNLGRKGKEGASDWSNYALTPEQLDYAANDTLITQELYNLLTPETLESNVYRLDIYTLRFCLYFQHQGMRTNHKYLIKARRELLKVIEELQARLPLGLNINSPKQVRDFLGVESSEKSVLERLAIKDPRCKTIVDLRAAKKELTFVELFNSHDFIFTLLNPIGAKTGRFTSKGSDWDDSYTNLQQIPRKLKSAFGVTKGSYYVTADYPTLEIRMAAAVYGDSFMVDSLKKNKDLHYETAALLFKKPISEISKRERKIAKVCNFGLLYGAGAGVLADFFAQQGEFDIMDDAPQIREKWRGIYKDLIELHNREFAFYKTHKGKLVYTPLGRPIYAATPNEALNFPIQGGGSECTKLSLYYMQKAGITPVNSVHDSIVCICDSEREAQEYAEIIKGAMEIAYTKVIANCKVNDLTLSVDTYIGEEYA